MKYRHRSTINARQTTEKERIFTLDGKPIFAYPGDYILTDDNGHESVMEKRNFESKFEPVPAEEESTESVPEPIPFIKSKKNTPPKLVT